MVVALIGNRKKKDKATQIKLLLHTVVHMSIAVLLFSEKLNITPYISALLKPKKKYVQSQNNALGKIQVCYFFAQNCEICMIRAPPVLFECKKVKHNRRKTF